MRRIPECWYLTCILAVLLIMLPVSAYQEKVIIYESDFTQDPGFITNNPSRYFWDVGTERYRFETEGGTNGYAYVPLEIGDTSFTLEYDITIESIRRNGAVRFGVTSAEMDISRGVNILGIFSNGREGKVMSLQVIDQNNHLFEVSSLFGSYCAGQPGCETKRYEENTTYHVVMRYNRELRQCDIRVTDPTPGGMSWGFYVPLARDIYNLNRLAITTKGDYVIGNNAIGYLNNIQLYTFREVAPTPEPTTIPATPVPPPETTIPTPAPTEAPLNAPALCGALALAAGLMMLRRRGQQ